MTQTSPPSNNVSLFISHKHENVVEAAKLRDRLNFLGAGRLRFFLSEEIPAGTSWRDWINEKLSKSNLLIFLFMNPTSKWDWCLYETGLFDGVGKGRIIVLHNPDSEPPDPLKHLQTVQAKQENVEQFLRDLYGGSTYGISPPAINLPFVEDRQHVEDEAKAICALFMLQTPEFQELLNQLSIQIVPAKGGGDPSNWILDADAETFKLFGLMKKRWTWGELHQHLGDNQWMQLLGRAILAGKEDKVMEPVDTSFTLPNGRIFQAILFRQEKAADGSRRFHVLLAEQATEGVVARSPVDHATLLSTLTLGNRFQWELCDKYLTQLPGWKTDEQITVGCEAIARSLSNIDKETAIREQREFPDEMRRRDRDRLLFAFSDKDDQREVAANLDRQQSQKTELRQSLCDRRLDKCEVLLKNLQGLNMLLVAKIAQRYTQVLQEVPLSANSSKYGARSSLRWNVEGPIGYRRTSARSAITPFSGFWPQ